MKRQPREERQKSPSSPKPTAPPQDHPVEEDPAAERGERIHTGKIIARGGKETGDVEGATERPT